MNSPQQDLKEYIKFLAFYHSGKTKKVGRHIETFKDSSVQVLMHGRGRFQKHIWHTSMISLAAAGVVTSGVFGGGSIVASSFPGAQDQDPRTVETFDPFSSGISLESLMSMKTSVDANRVRDQIIDYEVKSGETLSQIADKFGISLDTIKWANDLNGDLVKPGDKLKILPLSGVAVTVKSGDNLESLAKKYNADSQAILDFPFNDVPDDFKLKAGQTLIIPDGSPPESKVPARSKIQPQYIAQGPSSSPVFDAPAGGGFIWPTQSVGISQYFAWYHPGIDLPNPSSPPIVAADSGVVIVSGWPDNYGYGNRVVVDHGNGYQTLYAHLSNIYVSVGEKVSRGQTIGQMGSTGRSTGTHLHFEIRYKGKALNPLAILK